MAAERIHIGPFLELAKQYPVFDVRSPGEYKHAHIPGAHSLPLFTDEERKEVGTAYKQRSREEAIKIGLDFFGPKMRKMVEEVEALVSRQPAAEDTQPPNHESKIILVYCWRGGMRSGAVSWLLDLYGFKVFTLAGGYKKFRNHVLDSFKQPYPFKILGGFTGSGKTELLSVLKEKGEKVIDLESIAGHKGSAFGNIGLPPQPTQEMFENILSCQLLACLPDRQVVILPAGQAGCQDESMAPESSYPAQAIWLEDESQRIGLVNLPNELWKNMRRSPVWFLDIPFEERLKHIVPEYGRLDPESLVSAIERISQKLGHLNAKTAILLLKEGKISESFEILLKYYDKFYFRSLHNREGADSLLHTVNCKSVSTENADLLLREIHPSLQKPLA
ncbi:MAG: tRNA 2-selenouridine(34) synthase MnmH [Sphingobacteriales bacterium]|nr:tRNA 2-selenouridine(34) synthase MnmH [Sphingobacteriales bacterium]